MGIFTRKASSKGSSTAAGTGPAQFADGISRRSTGGISARSSTQASSSNYNYGLTANANASTSTSLTTPSIMSPLSGKFPRNSHASLADHFPLPKPPDPDVNPAAYLKSIYAVRERSAKVFDAAQRGRARHFAVDMSKFEETAGYVVSIIKVSDNCQTRLPKFLEEEFEKM